MLAAPRIKRLKMEAEGLVEAGTLRSLNEFRRDPYRWLLRPTKVRHLRSGRRSKRTTAPCRPIEWQFADG
jgi:hypothetical protein